MSNKVKLKKGDEVIVLAGKDKVKTGKITFVKPQVNKVIVAGINKVKKHTRPTQDNPQGGIVEKEMSINMSNLMLLDKNKPVKVSFKVSDKGKRMRINRKNGNIIK